VRELHVVAVSEDGRHVLLGATKNASKGTYRVRLDARLVSAVRGDLGASHDQDLSPKEIQARLRAGESAEQIARSAGMPITRVERFAGPVAGERLNMIEGAREAFVVRGRLGRSTQPMGRAVDAALGAAEPSWTARREDDGRWFVQVSWTARGRSRTASWRYEPHERSLEAADPASAALGHVESEHEPRRTAKKPASAPAEPTRKPAAKKAVKKAAKAPAKKAPTKATKKPAAKPAAKKAAPKKPAKAPAKKTLKKAAPTKKVVKKAPAKAKAAAKPVASKAAPKPARPRLQVVPDPPRKQVRAADERDGVKSRASVPAWADVLLGTTPNDQ
jgi:hypothetical protein